MLVDLEVEMWFGGDAIGGDAIGGDEIGGDSRFYDFLGSKSKFLQS